MIEKRFKFDRDTVAPNIKTPIVFNNETMSIGEVLDKLNELSDENEQLKEQLEICKDARQAYKQDWKSCVSYCDTYKDEIHTLKDNIQGLIEENKMLKNNVEKLSEDVRIISANRDCDILEDENEQLKQHNVELVNKIDFLERIVDGDV